MGNKIKKPIGLPYEHIKTKVKIKENNSCSKCPFCIYAKDDETVTFGIGNIFANFIFVLPHYDINSKIGDETSLSLLINFYNKITSKNIFEEVYITRLVKCTKNTDHNLYNSCVQPCSYYFNYEIGKATARHIVFFGSTHQYYLNNKEFFNIPNNKIVYKTYSSDVLYYDNDKVKQLFTDSLTAILSNN